MADQSIQDQDFSDFNYGKTFISDVSERNTCTGKDCLNRKQTGQHRSIRTKKE